jgi:tetratricopeptide (TPR) repeat protein
MWGTFRSVWTLKPACCAGFCLSVFVFAAFSSAQVQESGDSVKAALTAAETHYTEQQYPQAESELRGLLRQVPHDYSANELLGLVLTAEGRDADATSYFENAVRKNPGSVPARENLAANYAKRNRNDLAEAEFRILVRLDPKNFELQHNCGEFYINRGKIAEAVVPLQAAQRLRPNDYANGYDLALAEMTSGRFTEAEAELKTLLEIKNTAELHSMLAEDYEKQSKFLPAATEYQYAAQMDPNENSIFDWGAELLRHKNLQEAEQVFESGVRLYPQSWRLNTGLGVAWHMLGDDQDAVPPLLHAVDLKEADPRSYSFLATLGRVPADQSSQVTARFARYAAGNPQSAEAQLYYAANLWQTDEASNDTSHADSIEELLKKAIALNPRLAQAHRQLGVFYARRDDYRDAAVEFKQAIKLDPSQPDAHYRLAQTLTRLGQEKEARQELEIFRKLKATQKEEDTIVAFLLTRQDKPK